MIPPSRKGGQGRGLREELVRGARVEGFVVDAGRRMIISGFSSRHDTTKEAGNKKSKGLANRGYGVKFGRKPRKKNPTHARKFRKQRNEEAKRKV